MAEIEEVPINDAPENAPTGEAHGSDVDAEVVFAVEKSVLMRRVLATNLALTQPWRTFLRYI